MDDGRLTDGQGRTVDFKNTVLIMTSNIAVGDLDSATGDVAGSTAGTSDSPAGADATRSDTQLRDALLGHFKPEFVNRLDDIVRFKPLTREQLSEIVELQVQRVIARVRERGVEVTLTEAARELLGDMGYDPTYGARPLRRAIQKQLTDRLALALLEGELRAGDAVTVDAADGRLTLDKAAAVA